MVIRIVHTYFYLNSLSLKFSLGSCSSRNIFKLTYALTTVTTTCRLSLSCLTLLTMISSTASRSTPVTYYSHICLKNSIYLTKSEPAHTTKLISIKQNCSIVQISLYVCVRMLHKYSYYVRNRSYTASLI